MVLNDTITEIINKYIVTISNYTIFFFKSLPVYKDTNYFELVYSKGLILIENIYNISILYLDSLVDIHNLCEKGYIYFVEFINQINLSGFNETYFELTMRDAIVFCYKKTILNLDCKILKENNKNDNYKSNIINIYIIISNSYINLLNISLYNLLDNDIKNKNINISLHELYEEILKKIIEIIHTNSLSIKKFIKKITNQIDINNTNIDNIDILDKKSYLLNITKILKLLNNNINHIKINQKNIFNDTQEYFLIEEFIKNIDIFFDKYLYKKKFILDILYDDIINEEFIINIQNNNTNFLINKIL